MELFHVNALVMSLIGTHLTGEQLVLDYSGDPHTYFRALQDREARTASVNPVELGRIVKARPNWPDSLDYLVTAAGPASKNVVNDFYDLYGPRLRQGFGLSEAVNFSFMMPLLDTADFKTYYMRSRPPVGLALTETDYAIHDGELYIKTPDRMLGYLLDERRSNIDGEGWLRTGDYATVRDGFVVLRGRVSESIRRKGTLVPPADVEDNAALPRDCGEYAVARVPRSGGDDVALFTNASWNTALSELTNEGSTPPFVFIRSNGLRLSPSGKVQRAVMQRNATEVLDGLGALGTLAPPKATIQWLDALQRAVFGDSPTVHEMTEEPGKPECGCRALLTGTTTTIITPRGKCPCYGPRFLTTDILRLIVICIHPNEADPEKTYEFNSTWENLGPVQQSVAFVGSNRSLVLAVERDPLS